MNKKQKQKIKNQEHWYLVAVFDESDKKPFIIGYTYTKKSAKAYARDRSNIIYTKVPKNDIILHGNHLEPLYDVIANDNKLYTMSPGEFDEMNDSFSDYISQIIDAMDIFVNSIPCIKFSNKELSHMVDLVYHIRDIFKSHSIGENDLFESINENETIRYYLTVTGNGRKKQMEYIQSERRRIKDAVKKKKG